MRSTKPNIGPRESRKRMRFGITLLAAGVVLALVLWLAPVTRWWRLSLLLLFFPGILGALEAREKT